MKFAIHDLSHDQLQTALAALNDAGVQHTANIPEVTVKTLDIVVGAPDPAPTPLVYGAPDPIPTATTTSLVPPTDVLKDAGGMPWDARIHSGKSADKSVPNKAGMWKRKKGIDDALFEQVSQELRLTIPANLDRRDEAPAAPVAPVAPTMPPAPVAPVAPVAAPVAPTMPPAPVAPVAPVAPAEVTVEQELATARQDIAHEVMMNQVNVAIQDVNNPVTATDLPGICARFGMSSLNDCIQRADIIGAIHTRLGGQ